MKLRELHYLFTPMSHNSKTGPMPVTYSPSVTCPDACSLKDGNGCYAEGGNTRRGWNNVDKKKWGMSWDRFLQKASSHLYKNQLWRHNVVGDLAGNNNVIDHQMLHELVEVNNARKAKGFTYTHKPVGTKGHELVNARAIYASNRSGFVINLSADTLEEADEKAALGIAPVVVVIPSNSPKRMDTPAGRKVIVCPAEYKSNNVQCINCGICQNTERNPIIAFRAHGTYKNKINKRHLPVIAA